MSLDAGLSEDKEGVPDLRRKELMRLPSELDSLTPSPKASPIVSASNSPEGSPYNSRRALSYELQHLSNLTGETYTFEVERKNSQLFRSIDDKKKNSLPRKSPVETSPIMEVSPVKQNTPSKPTTQNSVSARKLDFNEPENGKTPLPQQSGKIEEKQVIATQNTSVQVSKPNVTILATSNKVEEIISPNQTEPSKRSNSPPTKLHKEAPKPRKTKAPPKKQEIPWERIFLYVDNKDWYGVMCTCKLFLDIGRKVFDPSIANNDAICWASYHGHTLLVESLLKDKRVNPTVSSNYPLRAASKKGHVNVVKVLLEDDRIDPCALNNFSFVQAARNGHLSVMVALYNSKKFKIEDRQLKELHQHAAQHGHTDLMHVLEIVQQRKMNSSLMESIQKESPRSKEKPGIDHATILKGMKSQVFKFREKWHNSDEEKGLQEFRNEIEREVKRIVSEVGNEKERGQLEWDLREYAESIVNTLRRDEPPLEISKNIIQDQSLEESTKKILELRTQMEEEKRRFQELLVQQKESEDLKIKELTRYVENFDAWVQKVIILGIVFFGIIFAVI